MIRETTNENELNAAEFVYMSIGPVMKHNYLCAVCRKYKAVLDMDRGILQPCWNCQLDGYELIKKIKPWWLKWLLK